MPELPEVETIVRDLKKTILNLEIKDVWTDFKKMVKKPTNFERFKKEIIGKKILNIWRRGKNIIFNLSGNKFLLIHQKLTGHLLLGRWELKNGKWVPLLKGPLEESVNLFIHLMFCLSNKKMLGLSDMRKFAKIELLDKESLEKELKDLGPEPLEKNFTFEKFKSILPKKGKIKQVLMDQKIISGIGNIYSDEILWEAKIHPLKEVFNLTNSELFRIYNAIKIILKKAIEMGGTSISDFRKLSGEPGEFEKERRVYQRNGENCFRCKAKINRIKTGGRSAHYCSCCQK